MVFEYMVENGCTTCKHARIKSDDRYFFCEKERMTMDFYISHCKDFEKRDDGLKLTQVFGWKGYEKSS